MSQPFVIIAVTNHGPRCSIDGYPGIVGATGTAQQAQAAASLPIEVVDGPDYEHPDPGPHRLLLSPGATASFALGTGTAYDGPVYEILSFSVTLPGSSFSALHVPVETNADSMIGTPIRLEVTAFVRGSHGPRF
jgi:hypothetical protein